MHKKYFLGMKFLAESSEMLCGKPLISANGRYYKMITELQDMNTEYDQNELNSLPSEKTLFTNFLCSCLFPFDLLKLAFNSAIHSHKSTSLIYFSQKKNPPFYKVITKQIVFCRRVLPGHVQECNIHASR